jgi:hypothetical protein
MICLGIALITVPFILSLSARILSRTQTPPVSGDSDDVTMGHTPKTEKFTLLKQRTLRANLVIKSKSLRLVTEQDIEDYLKKDPMLRSRTFHMGTHIFSVTVSYKGKTPSWWGEKLDSPIKSALSSYVLHRGKRRKIISWRDPVDGYDGKGKVYRAEFAVDIPEAQQPSPSTFGGFLMIAHSSPAGYTAEMVDFTLPVPHVTNVRKTGSS